jgi:two-component system, NarL family, response regulator LiaR
MIRILIVDNYCMVRNGLRTFIEGAIDLEVAGEAADGQEAVAMARLLRPDVVLMDVHLPGMNGIAATSIICSDIPGTKVVMLSSLLTGTMVVDAIRAGASGYLLKDTEPTELRTAIKAVVAGQTHLSLQASECLIHEIRTPQEPVRLTDREIDVLHLLAQGYSNKAIMIGLHIGEDTVKSHVRHILSKLGVETRTQAVLAALRLGLVDHPLEENAPYHMQRIS